MRLHLSMTFLVGCAANGYFEVPEFHIQGDLKSAILVENEHFFSADDAGYAFFIAGTTVFTCEDWRASEEATGEEGDTAVQADTGITSPATANDFILTIILPQGALAHAKEEGIPVGYYYSLIESDPEQAIAFLILQLGSGETYFSHYTEPDGRIALSERNGGITATIDAGMHPNGVVGVHGDGSGTFNALPCAE